MTVAVKNSAELIFVKNRTDFFSAEVQIRAKHNFINIAVAVIFYSINKLAVVINAVDSKGKIPDLVNTAFQQTIFVVNAILRSIFITQYFFCRIKPCIKLFKNICTDIFIGSKLLTCLYKLFKLCPAYSTVI